MDLSEYIQGSILSLTHNKWLTAMFACAGSINKVVNYPCSHNLHIYKDDCVTVVTLTAQQLKSMFYD